MHIHLPIGRTAILKQVPKAIITLIISKFLSLEHLNKGKLGSRLRHSEVDTQAIVETATTLLTVDSQAQVLPPMALNQPEEGADTSKIFNGLLVEGIE
ncbi:MAG: hypothetical protein LQ342_002681, partial [Letrouitia transgressa]